MLTCPGHVRCRAMSPSGSGGSAMTGTSAWPCCPRVPARPPRVATLPLRAGRQSIHRRRCPSSSVPYPTGTPQTPRPGSTRSRSTHLTSSFTTSGRQSAAAGSSTRWIAAGAMGFPPVWAVTDSLRLRRFDGYRRPPATHDMDPDGPW